MSNDDLIKNDVTYAYIGLIAYIIYIVILLVCVILNGVKLYQDFYTKERKPVAHLKEKPKITPVYTAIATQTQAAIFLFLVADIFEASTYGFARTEVACDSLQTAAGITYQIAQTFLYLLLLTRLYWVYANSEDNSVSLNKIIVYGVILIMYNVIIVVAMATIWTSKHPYVYDGIDRDVNYCDGTLEPITGILMTIQEIVTTITFLYAFYKQLQITVSKPTCDPVVVYAGRQLFILSAVSMIATVILIMVTAILDINFIIGADAVVNVICLLMLEPYWEGLFYQKSCCICRYLVAQCICCDALKSAEKLGAAQLAQIVDEKNNSKGAPLLAVRLAVSDGSVGDNNAKVNSGQTANVDENVNENANENVDENL